MRELMLFRAGRYRLALALGAVRRVHPLADLRPAAGGSCVLDGRRMRFYDLGHWMGGRRSDPESPRVIRMEAADRELALRVDAVERVAWVDGASIVPLPPAFGGRPARWFPAVVRDGAELALLLSPEGMLGVSTRSAPAEPSIPSELAEAVGALLDAERTAETFSSGLRRTLKASLARRLRALPARMFGRAHR
jgi:chemotaxis signal transduction protein